MKSLLRVVGVGVMALVLVSCNFFEFVQHAKLDTDAGIDAHRTGCILDEDTLTRMYVQYDQMEYHISGRPTPTPRPIKSSETEQAAQFKKLWEAGCETGRRDAVGREQADLLSLQDEINILQKKLDSISGAGGTPTPGATPTPTASGS